MVWACFFFFLNIVKTNRKWMNEFFFGSKDNNNLIEHAGKFVFIFLIHSLVAMVGCWLWWISFLLMLLFERKLNFIKGQIMMMAITNNSKRMSIISSPSFILFKVKLFLSIEFFSTKKKVINQIRKDFHSFTYAFEIRFFFHHSFPISNRMNDECYAYSSNLYITYII